jgi:hypothetical protein
MVTDNHELRARVKLWAESGPASVCRSVVEMELRYIRKAWKEAASDVYQEWSRKTEQDEQLPPDYQLAEALSGLQWSQVEVKQGQAEMRTELTIPSSGEKTDLRLKMGDYQDVQCFIRQHTHGGQQTVNEVTCDLVSGWLPDNELERKDTEAHLETSGDEVRESFKSLYSVLSKVMHHSFARFEDLTLVIPRPRPPLSVGHCFAIASLAKRAKVPYKFVDLAADQA